jgi:hypothetical protein
VLDPTYFGIELTLSAHLRGEMAIGRYALVLAPPGTLLTSLPAGLKLPLIGSRFHEDASAAQRQSLSD